MQSQKDAEHGARLRTMVPIPLTPVFPRFDHQVRLRKIRRAGKNIRASWVQKGMHKAPWPAGPAVNEQGQGKEARPVE